MLRRIVVCGLLCSTVTIGSTLMTAAPGPTRLYQPWEKPYFVLGAGDSYDMKARRVIKYADGTTPARGRGGLLRRP